VLFYKRSVTCPTSYTFVSMNTDSSVSTVFLRLPGDDFFSDIPVHSMFTKSRNHCLFFAVKHHDCQTFQCDEHSFHFTIRNYCYSTCEKWYAI